MCLDIVSGVVGIVGLIELALFLTMSPRFFAMINSTVVMLSLVLWLSACNHFGVPPRQVTDGINCRVNPEDCR